MNSFSDICGSSLSVIFSNLTVACVDRVSTPYDIRNISV